MWFFFFFCMVWGECLNSSFSMWLSCFPNEKSILTSVNSWMLCQRSVDCKCQSLLLDSRLFHRSVYLCYASTMLSWLKLPVFEIGKYNFLTTLFILGIVLAILLFSFLVSWIVWKSISISISQRVGRYVFNYPFVADFWCYCIMIR